MPDSRWQWVVKGLVVACIIMVVALGLGVNKGSDLETRIHNQELSQALTVKFEALCLDPKDPAITDDDINDMRERLGLRRLSIPSLIGIRQRMGMGVH